MKQAICRFIYHKLLGWKAEVSVPDFKKCIICAAPHTTNWDLFIGKLFITAIGRESGFLMKRNGFSSRWNHIPKIGRYPRSPRQAYFYGRPTGATH